MASKRTAERTDEELQIAFEEYVRSKTVNGRYCPTPELHRNVTSEDDDPTPPFSRMVASPFDVVGG